MLLRPSSVLSAFLHLWASFVVVRAQQNFFPAAVPLALRTPAFNCWGNGSDPLLMFPSFWTQKHILGWAGLIKVDAVTYRWLGATPAGIPGTYLSTEVTPTRTIIAFAVGPYLIPELSRDTPDPFWITLNESY
ncbi:hypothetical protein C8R46DRAFT_1033094 [Mycena filopes]|nr:hypothetical protein C8R46DRAFT_1033094 [Mycena filopes]